MVNKATVILCVYFPPWNTSHVFAKHIKEYTFIHPTDDANPFALPSSTSITAVFLFSEILIVPQAWTLLLPIAHISEWQSLASEKQFES